MPLPRVLRPCLAFLLFTCGLLLTYTGATAQRNLTNSRTTSYYTYIYKITNAEAKQLYEKGMQAARESFFHTKVDSFPTQLTYQKRLTQGHYLYTYTSGPDLEYSLHSKTNAQVQLLKNHVDLAAVLHDSLGNLISNALVQVNKKKVPFDAATQSYRLAKHKKSGLLSVTQEGFTFYVPLATDAQRLPYPTPLWKKIVFRKPLYYVWQPFRNIVQSLTYHEPQGLVRSIFSIFDQDYRDNYGNQKNKPRGYLALNKPMYRPNDTVRYKAFLVKKNGKPYRKPLIAEVNGNSKTKRVGALKPYRPGAYEGAFVLHDSLQFRLDTYVNLNLMREKKWDDKRIINSQFKYEDYELKENTFTLRLEHKEHFAGTTNQVVVRGADANGLTLPDARVELTVLTRQIRQTKEAVQFIPDTLWVHQQPLENSGETTIKLPPTIFPKAKIVYEVQAAFLNSSNERTEKSANGTYSFEEGHLLLTLKNDSVLAQYLEGEKSLPKAATLVLRDEKNKKLQTQKVQLPALLPLQPYARDYEISTGNLKASLSLRDESANFQFFSDRTADSLFLTIDNPRKLPFWYFIYRNNQLIDRGQDTTSAWYYTRKASNEEPYYASVQYVWGGQVQSNEYNAPFRKRELDITVNAPATVYPGQQTNLTLEVKDAKGKPAPHVDLTAYALTSKFKAASPPNVPFFGSYQGRKNRRSFKIADTPDRGSQLLHWNTWRQEMGLDSLSYYQLLYPAQGMFTNYAASSDSLTQLAPFVVDSGRVVPVHVIYLNQVPVYFSGTDVVPPYSFPADSGYHHLKLRTANHLITLDSVYLKQGQKLILSIDQNKLPQQLQEMEKGRFTASEQETLTQYLVPVEQNFSSGLSYLKQGRLVQFLPNSHQPRGYFTQKTRGNILLTGPFKPDVMQFHTLGSFTTNFTPEPNYTHHFEPGLLKLREKPTFPGRVLLSNKTDSYVLALSRLAEIPLTEASLLKQWENTQYQFWLSHLLNQPEYRTLPGYGRLQWHLDSTFQMSPQVLFLYAPDAATHQVSMYRGSLAQLHQVYPGEYQFTLVFPDQSHLSARITVKPDGVLRLNFTKSQLQKPAPETKALEKYLQNSVERAMQSATTTAPLPKPVSPNVPSVSYSYSGGFSDQVWGRVLDKETGEPMPGTTVQVKGTSSAVATDVDGRFTITTPANAILVVSFIGYVSQEVPVKGSSRIEIKLASDARALSEVVVVGYGAQEKREMTYSMAVVRSELNGRVAGLVVGNPGSSINIRGVSSIQGNNQPLIIVDGVPFSGNLGDISASSIASTTTLKDAAAKAIYGSAAANGVIIITTKKGKADAEQSLMAGAEADATSSIRSYFSDYAFWQPRLATDKQGKATFPVTFPGDVTSWKTHVLAMDGNKRSGTASTEIRSFKAMMATLSGPRFLIEGDKTQIIGKAVNYLPDTASVQTTFAFNGQTLRQQNLKLGRVFTDTVLVQAPAVAPDSVELLFSLQQGAGFSDGERRYIGVYKKGVLERKGQFLSLPVDTSLTLTFDPAKGPVHFYAQSNLLQVMLDEINALHRYEYWCNEQAASKLKGLLWEKRIQAALDKPFEHEKMVRRLIRHLEKTQQQDGTWSWWETGPAYIWISHHVTEALVMAQQEGFATSFKKQPLIDYLTYHVEKKDAPDKIRALEILQQLQAKVDFPAYVSKVEKQPKLSLEEQFRITRLRQKLNLPAPLDTLQKYRHATMLGGVYWGKERSSLFDNHISNTLLVYEILKAAGGHARELLKIQAFLLSERRTGHWRNTFESARVLETLLPDLVKEKGVAPENNLVLTGALNTTLRRFPVDTTFIPTQPLTLRKQGLLPLYLTAYQNEWIAQPTRVDKDFVVRTSFANTKSAQATLTAGKPVELKVEVDVKADASYVMIEVPIPAGCTYDAKSSWGRNEAHREYFRHKVAIFSNHLSKGSYTFTIQLLPRYKGTYTLNPARAELMYFPTFFGREGLKEVQVK
ncbi:carboxypeptidase-like regulatory domain-containing protein [Rufibacter sp. XAAS-G3-1]|uniref:carboxypeptidase-like regulatory domain-containing protein n=1 Tax=Rufibacter sp. XAAS-G3-1 TaxID=2729134 RepID=UPI0015E7576D|nr:carboxypeptidase-like regulatory domain-containing protein [Rufibacter sp. XAAS-G3-1]